MAKAIPTYIAPYSLWCIVNPRGQFWSASTYRSPEDAEKALRKFWVATPENIKKFKIIRVKVTIEAINPNPERD